MDADLGDVAAEAAPLLLPEKLHHGERGRRIEPALDLAELLDVVRRAEQARERQVHPRFV